LCSPLFFLIFKGKSELFNFPLSPLKNSLVFASGRTRDREGPVFSPFEPSRGLLSFFPSEVLPSLCFLKRSASLVLFESISRTLSVLIEPSQSSSHFTTQTTSPCFSLLTYVTKPEGSHSYSRSRSSNLLFSSAYPSQVAPLSTPGSRPSFILFQTRTRTAWYSYTA